MYMKDSGGTKSLTATLAYISFFVVMIKVLFNGAAVTVGSFSYEFGAIDSLMIGAIFGPVLGSYTARRWKTPANNTPVPDPAPEDDAGSKPGDGRR